MAKVVGHVCVRVGFGHKSGQDDNFAVSFFFSKIDRGDVSNSLRVILVSSLLIKTSSMPSGRTSIYGALDDYDMIDT